MRAIQRSLIVALITVSWAEQGASQATLFSAKSVTEKRDVLLEIIKHDSRHYGAAVALTIQAALVDRDDTVRELGLVAVVSRAMAPSIAPGTSAANDWVLDWEHLQSLRPQVTGVLTDPVARVRVQAVAALACLDFDFSTLAIRISPSTEAVLIQRFQAEESANVRSKIVIGLGTDGRDNSLAIRSLIRGAIVDPDASVRHAATSHIKRLDPDNAIPLLIDRLTDPDRSVRAQAAIGLSAHAQSLGWRGHVPAIETALRTETDQRAREQLERLLRVARPR